MNIIDLKDLLLTPIYLLIIYAVAFQVRPKVTNKFTKKYFIPALTVKLIGAIALGLIYTFYYDGGDTHGYYKQGNYIFDVLLEDPIAGFKLIFLSNIYRPDTARYAVNIEWFLATPEYFVIRAAGLFAIISFGTYTVIALLFAVASFTGMWALYITFLKLYPQLHKRLAIAVLFLPSVFFWGSGLMKDTLCIGALGWLFWAFYTGFIEKKNIVMSVIVGTAMILLVMTVKVYILLAFLPPAVIWIFNENSTRIKNRVVKIVLKPLLLAIGIVGAYFGTTKLTEGHKSYDIENIAERTKINSEYIYRVSIKQDGSAYSIGEFDGTFNSMISVIPEAINVALFRPYLFEVKNPVMLLSSLEATFFLLLTIYYLFKIGILKTLKVIATTPTALFCITFALILAAAVGMNSFNFGTLVRYKIPMMPFYLSGIYILYYEGYVKFAAKRMKKKAILA